ncbi:shikimate kinase [Salisediminibacterium selenitireducens]|uniref:shikimate kinase n=1 Tax=Salisediminibacterium selenitireducens TaxID=85683 RepID=UPI000673F888|nr:shikimate kinase [Salisediminibacterium selenitireducens]
MITGIACVGKSTVGQLLAERMGHVFYDLDLEIEQAFGMPISRIKEQITTEREYRKKTAPVLEKLMQGRDWVIASTPSGLKDHYWKLIEKDPEIVTVVLRDRAARIVERLTFYDDDSRLIPSPVTAANRHLYERDIQQDMTYYGTSHRKADVKFQIKGRPANQAAEALYEEIMAFTPKDKEKEKVAETLVEYDDREPVVCDVPHPLVQDYDRLLRFMMEKDVYVTKKKREISSVFLPELNGLLALKRPASVKGKAQAAYPVIHLFFTLAINSGLLAIQEGPRGRMYVKADEERLRAYRQLSDLEIYYLLLETLWTDTDWANVTDRGKTEHVYLFQKVLIQIVRHARPGEPFPVRRDWVDRFADYFSWFAFWTEAEDEEYRTFEQQEPGFRNVFVLVHVHRDAKERIQTLLFDRNLEQWNLPFRKVTGELNPQPGDAAKEWFGLDEEDEFERQLQEAIGIDRRHEAFFEAFVSLHSEEVIERTLPRNVVSFEPGLHMLRITYLSVSREMIVSQETTLAELHGMILEAFDLTDDHLYAFFLDGILYSEPAVYAPQADEEHRADEVTIGSLGLRKGQSFVYVYNFVHEIILDIDVCFVDDRAEVTDVRSFGDAIGHPPWSDEGV